MHARQTQYLKWLLYLDPHSLPSHEMPAGPRDEIDCSDGAPVFVLFERCLDGEVMSTGDPARCVSLVLRHPMQEPGMAVVVGRDLESDEQLPPQQGDRFKKAAARKGQARANPNETEPRTEIRVRSQQVAEDRRAAVGQLRRLHDIHRTHTLNKRGSEDRR